jgi:signal transduction histidine kinase
MDTQNDINGVLIDASLLQKILDTLPIGVWVADQHGVLIANNPAGRAIWAGERWVGPQSYAEYKGWWSATGKPILANEWGMARAALAGEISQNEMVDIECFDGSRKTILNSARPILDTDGHMLIAVATNQDITELKKTQDALLLARQQLEALTSAALELQEQERKRLSMELHDDIGQTLSALKIMIETARRRSSDSAITDILLQASAATDTLVTDVREIARRLRPPPLDDLGLVAALRWHLDNLSLMTPLKIDFHAELGDQRLAEELELGCFRIVQEAVSNVLRHSGADCLTIKLIRQPYHLLVSIQDNGCGFDPEQVHLARRHHPLGLLGMRERTIGLHGELRIHSAPGNGTDIEAIIPIETAT